MGHTWLSGTAGYEGTGELEGVTAAWWVHSEEHWAEELWGLSLEEAVGGAVVVVWGGAVGCRGRGLGGGSYWSPHFPLPPAWLPAWSCQQLSQAHTVTVTLICPDTPPPTIHSTPSFF